MNNIFQYLYDKKGKQIPFEFKLLNNLPLNNSDLYVNGDLYLYYSNITSLPDNLTVNGSLDLFQSKINSLPNNLTVNGDLTISNTKISELPDDLTVLGDFYCHRSPLATNIKNDITLLNKYSKEITGKLIDSLLITI